MNDTYVCMFLDITRGCNLRCKFCVQDWKNGQPNMFMPKETFKKVIEIMPLAHDEWFLVSCGFESTIHPQFFELFEMIPKELKVKTILTTNLSKKFTIEQLERLSKLNIAMLNISFESFNPSIYEELRYGSKYINFINNLENLVKILKKKKTFQLRYISMLFKQNLHEVESIVRACNEKYLSTRNEFRTPFKWTIPYNDQDWMGRSLITEEEWQDLSERVKEIPCNIVLYRPEVEDVLVDNYKGINLNFFINADGSLNFIGKNMPYFPDELKGDVSLNDIKDPYNYLKNIFEKVYDKQIEYI